MPSRTKEGDIFLTCQRALVGTGRFTISLAAHGHDDPPDIARILLCKISMKHKFPSTLEGKRLQ